jgi:hypothetical protein
VYDVEFLTDHNVANGKLENLPSVGDIIEVNCTCCDEITAFEVTGVIRKYFADGGSIRDLGIVAIMLEAVEDD